MKGRGGGQGGEDLRDSNVGRTKIYFFLDPHFFRVHQDSTFEGLCGHPGR